ncbi:MAG: acetyltransferase [Pelolinea sp.]|jgi:sugar O-acyltransferase (sialic acid O-acetyltransferase NeuD family)|nr:acetyltransferase [Pelolinea sp.]
MQEKNEATKVPVFDFDPTKVIIYGGGGLSKMIIEAVRVLGCYQIEGIIDDGMKKGTDVIGSPVLGGAEALPELAARGIRMAVNSVGGIGDFQVRLNVFHILAKAGFLCPAIVHPTAHVDPSARLAAGVLVLAQSYVSGNARVGMGTLINNSVVISHDNVIGACVNLSPGTMLAGDVVIDDFAQLGMNVNVNIGVHIGSFARIANGATIKGNVPQGGRVYAGMVWPPRDLPKTRTA